MEKLLVNIFKENLIQTDNDSFEQSHSAKKFKKGDCLGLFNIYYVTKYFKNWTLSRHLKNIREKKKKRKKSILSQSHSAAKLERGDPLGFLKLQFAVKYQKT